MGEPIVIRTPQFDYGEIGWCPVFEPENGLLSPNNSYFGMFYEEIQRVSLVRPQDTGGYFLLHRFDADMPDGNIRGIEIIGYREESKSYSMHSFDSLGNASVMQARMANEVWSFTGDNVRFTGGFRENGNVFAGLWELCTGDGSVWQPWMDIRLTKEKPIVSGLHSSYK